MKMRISSTSPASRNEPASRGPPSSSTLWMPSPPSLSSASVTRSASLPPDATTTSTPAALQRLEPRAVGRARRDDDQAGVVRRAGELALGRQPRLGVEHDAGRLARRVGRARRQQRVVGKRRPDPDADGVHLRAPAVHELAALLTRDPLRVAGLGRDLPVEAHRRLEHRRAGGPCGRACGTAGSAAGRRATPRRPRPRTSMPSSRRMPRPAPGGLVGRVVGCHHDALDAGVHDRVGAGRRPAVMAAGLERHVHGRPDRIGHACAERRHLGVIAPVGGVIALARAPRRRARPPRPRAGWDSCVRDRARRARWPFASNAVRCPSRMLRRCRRAPGPGLPRPGRSSPCYAQQPLAQDSTVGPAVSNARQACCSSASRARGGHEFLSC